MRNFAQKIVEKKIARKILIIRFSSLGDILLTTPLIRSLRKETPKSKIHFLVKDEYKDVLINNPHLDKIHLLKIEKPKELIKELKKEQFDLIIDLQKNLRSLKISAGIKAPKLRFNKRTFAKLLLVKTKINLLKNSPQIPVRYAGAIPNFRLDGEGLELITHNRPSELMNTKEKIIGFCPGTRHFTKRWPEEYFVDLGKKLIEAGYTIALFGGKEDRELCKNIGSRIPSAIDLSNDNRILQTAADMKKCTAVICNDSGLMHAACAVQIPVLAIFGSTVKEFGFTPYNCTNLILENKSLSCRPCTHIGRESCPLGHFKCMNELTPGLAFKHLMELINK